MGGIGWHNPLPMDVGGGETDTERVWTALRDAVGEGGAGPVDGLEDAWRQIKAQAIAADFAAVERAALQGVPGYQTDHLEVYEQLLSIPRADTTAERQAAVAAALVSQLAADVPSILQALKQIDPAFEVDAVQWAQATVVYFGKAFGPLDGAPPYGTGQASGMSASGWPNYASDFVLHVRYQLAPGQTKPPAESTAAARRMLGEVLPAWVDFTIYTGVGFLLDGGPNGDSLLDLTAFG